MEAKAPSGPCSVPGDHGLWLAGLAVLLAWQGWLTLVLLRADHDPAALLDEQPVLSGRHALHQYHGSLGAHSLLRTGTLSCYDPAFNAGYPKTPIFDSGSRPAEIALALAGGKYRPAAYKLGLAVLCTLVPVLLYVSARGTGLVRSGAVLAAGLGVLVCWGEIGRDTLEAGDVDLFLTGLMTATQSGLLVSYHRAPNLRNLAGAILAGFVSWLAHPLLMVLQLPLFLAYYLTVGPHHRLIWHVGLLGGLLGAILANSFWLLDWLNYWWIREPLRIEGPVLLHRTFRTIADAEIWGGPADRLLIVTLLASALAGAALHNQTGQRSAARLFGLGTAGFFALSVAGIAWPPLGRLCCYRLVLPGLWFAVVPAAHAVNELALFIRRGIGWAGIALVGGVAVIAGCACPALLAATVGWRTPKPLQIGLDDDRAATVQAIRTLTTESARILWEDRRGPRVGSYWTALLPLLTGRSFIGGLDPDAGIEHTANGLCDQVLAGQQLRDWTDSELHEYCERYNVGWIVSWTQATTRRFARWPEAEALTTLTDGETGGCLFAVKRSTNYALTGSAHWQRADADRIVLSEVVPRDGVVVLSLHYQTGLRATPSRVRLERELDPRDAIPFVRLRVDEPVALVTLTWVRRNKIAD